MVGKFWVDNNHPSIEGKTEFVFSQTFKQKMLPTNLRLVGFETHVYKEFSETARAELYLKTHKNFEENQRVVDSECEFMMNEAIIQIPLK